VSVACPNVPSVEEICVADSANKGIAGRAVLLDWAGWMESRNMTFDTFGVCAIHPRLSHFLSHVTIVWKHHS
jgi:hypothetical protein